MDHIQVQIQNFLNNHQIFVVIIVMIQFVMSH
jgi:hypothetical protein